VDCIPTIKDPPRLLRSIEAMREAARDLTMLAMAGVMDLSDVVEVVERKRRKG